jgi:hypothetical protein
VLWRRYRPILRWLIAVVALVLIADAMLGRRGELVGFGYVIDHLRWWWLPVAVMVEAASVVAFAGIQARLLRSAGVATPTRPLIGITLASNAIANSFPGGPAVAAVYGFRWYRRLGADDAVAAWAMVGTTVTAGFCLSLVAAGGLALATSKGASLDLIPVVVGALVVTAAAAVLFVYERPLAVAVRWAVGLSRRLTGRPHGDVQEHIERVVARVTVVRLGWRSGLALVCWGLSNWLADCACFALSFMVVGVGIPWKALLLAYGAGQLAANLPITPGGLGAVTGSITLALAYFGGAHASTIYVVLIYRLISFWGEVALGWGAWSWGAVSVRRGHWPREVPDLPAERVPVDAVADAGVPLGLAVADPPAADPPAADPPVADPPAAGPTVADPTVAAIGTELGTAFGAGVGT